MSFLWRDSLYFKLVESIFIGFGAAHALVLGYNNVVSLGLNPLAKGNLLPLIPVIMGLALYTRFLKQYAWVSRIPLSFLYGLGAAVAIRGRIGSEVVTQIAATVIKITSVNDVLIIAGVLTTITYFFFSFGNSPALQGTARVGRWFMMVCFGASFSTTAVGRISILVDRLNFLWGTRLGLAK
jgi:hypothetical protein